MWMKDEVEKARATLVLSWREMEYSSNLIRKGLSGNITKTGLQQSAFITEYCQWYNAYKIITQ